MKNTMLCLILVLGFVSSEILSQEVRLTEDKISYFLSGAENGFLNFNGSLNTMELKSAAEQDILISSGANGTVRFRTNGMTRMLIDEAGGIGIGSFLTPPAGYKLAVDGKVICEDLFVELSSDWPDYVFHPDYQLLPLDEFAVYLAHNRHLPGIPSAQEMETGGRQDVGQVQRQLLEKIEELSLYIVQLHQENGRLGQEIQALKEILKTGNSERNEEK